MDRILVTGAAGFIGKPLTHRLINSGLFEVHTTHTSSMSFLEGANGHVCNLLSDEVHHLIRAIRPQIVLHLAWNLGDDGFQQDKRNIEWVESSLGMLRYFAENEGIRFIFAGSSSEYYDKGGLLSEGENPQIQEPDTLYGIAKKCVTMAGIRLAQIRKFQFLSARIFPVFGPGYTKTARVIVYAINEMLQDRKVVCLSPHSLWDFIYIDDAVNILYSLILSKMEGIVNVASGIPHSVGHTFETIATILNKGHLLVMNNECASPRILAADISRLRNELQILPQMTLEEGLKKTIKWKTRIGL